MPIKIQLIDSFTYVQANDDTTVEQCIMQILSRKEIDQKYIQISGMVVSKEGEYGDFLAKEDKVMEWHKKNYQFAFRFFAFPQENEILKASPDILNILQYQAQRMILSGFWFAEKEQDITCAAYRLLIDFGSYKSQDIKFVNKLLSSYIMQQYIKDRGIDKAVLQEWIRLSGIKSRDEYIKDYMIYISKNIVMYGCAMTDIVVTKVGDKDYKTQCYMGVRRDGQLVLYIGHKEANLEINDEKAQFIIHADKEMQCQCTSISKFKKVIEFMKSAKFDDQEAVQGKEQSNLVKL